MLENASAAGLGSLRIQLLGDFRVYTGSGVVEETAWRLRKAKSIVKLLALAPGHRLHRDRVMDRLWPELEPNAAANNLRYALHVARRTLEPAPAPGPGSLHIQGDLLVLCPAGSLWTDVEAFEAAAAIARRTQDAQLYRAAVEVYTGDLLPDDRYEDWVISRREELRGVYLTLLAELARVQEDRGEHGAAIAALQRVVAAEPAHDEAHVGLMRLYALTGQRLMALRQYQQLKEAFQRLLDAEPDAGAERLYQEILDGSFPPGLDPARLDRVPGPTEPARGRPERSAARSVIEERLTTVREEADPRRIADALYRLGRLAHAKGDDASAYSLVEASIRILRGLNDNVDFASSLAV